MYGDEYSQQLWNYRLKSNDRSNLLLLCTSLKHTKNETKMINLTFFLDFNHNLLDEKQSFQRALCS